MSERTSVDGIEVPEIGDPVIFHDPTGQAHDALVTNAFGYPGMQTLPAINVVVVSKDTDKLDQYGRQLERYTSCTHKSLTAAHGYYWRWKHEESNPINPGTARV